MNHQPATPTAASGTDAEFPAGFAVLTAALIVVIAYVSLFPFRPRAHAGSPWLVFLSSRLTHDDRFDMLANILLYIPLGFSLARCAPRRSTFSWGSCFSIQLALGIMGGALLSLAIELTQVYDVGRASSVWDFYTNTAGAALGAIVGASAIGISAKVFPALMVLCWLGFRLMSPWAPPQPAVSSLGTRVAETVEMFGAWLGIGLLLEFLMGAPRSRWVLFFLIAVATAFPLSYQAWYRLSSPSLLLAFTPENSADLAGACLAFIVWIAFLTRAKNRALLAAVPFAFFVLFVSLDALRPFHFLPQARHFGLVPFLGMIKASRESVVSSTLSKVFLYGTMLWTATRAGWSLRRATVAGTLLVLALRITQIYLPVRSAEITDAIMLLLIAGAIKVLNVPPSRSGKSNEAVTDAAHGEQMPRVGGVLL